MVRLLTHWSLQLTASEGLPLSHASLPILNPQTILQAAGVLLSELRIAAGLILLGALLYGGEHHALVCFMHLCMAYSLP